jgi:hypothetical protein
MVYRTVRKQLLRSSVVGRGWLSVQLLVVMNVCRYCRTPELLSSFLRELTRQFGSEPGSGRVAVFPLFYGGPEARK